ncbi:MAG: hypothetical protein FD130_1006 [Halothiobacillaceae bacterium]|nr:MAG: hypothetical protein FD130_1006 [Halothiobacillaceae bacterium]
MHKMTSPTAPDSPQVITLPPFIYLGGLAVGVILHLLKPWPFFPESLAVSSGMVLIVTAILLAITAIRGFIHAATNIDVRKPATCIVVTGPYRFTRNPMYLAMTLLVVGIAIGFNALWILVTLIPTLLVIQFWVIRREEAYLTKKFGEEYLRYKAKVRPWL